MYESKSSIKVTKIRGNYLQCIGYSRKQNLFLSIEETLFLTERGCLKLRNAVSGLELTKAQVFEELLDSDESFAEYQVAHITYLILRLMHI